LRFLDSALCKFGLIERQFSSFEEISTTKFPIRGAIAPLCTGLAGSAWMLPIENCDDQLLLFGNSAHSVNGH
jgi:hypothetical protein